MAFKLPSVTGPLTGHVLGPRVLWRGVSVGATALLPMSEARSIRAGVFR